MTVFDWRHFLKGAYTIWYRDVLGLVRDRARLFGSLIGNIVMLVVLGFGLGSAIGRIGASAGLSGVPGVPFIQFSFATILCTTAMLTALQSTMSIVWDREFGLMRKVLVAPVSRTSVAFGKVAGGVTQATITAVMLMIAVPLIALPVGLLQMVEMLLLVIMVSAVVTALGILVAARQKSTQGFQVVSIFVIMPLTLLSFGTMLPVSGEAGRVLRLLSQFNPVAYGIDAMRQIALGSQLPSSYALHPPAIDALILVAFFVAFLIPGVLLFRKQD
jgi:ABC-2 type transport system permease protein